MALTMKGSGAKVRKERVATSVQERRSPSARKNKLKKNEEERIRGEKRRRHRFEKAVQGAEVKKRKMEWDEEERARALEEKQRRKEIREKQKRKLMKRTRKGQPVLKNHMDRLLEKLQKEKERF